jgi:hypothetical protein
MTFGLLRLVFLFGAWWATLWYVLPVDLQQPVPELVSWHFIPPVLAITAWGVFKRVLTWHADRKAKAEAASCEAEQRANIEAARVARQEELNLRRVHVECRAVWAVVVEKPEWCESDTQCSFWEVDADGLYGKGWPAALAASTQEVFDSALQQSAALAWLPVYVAQGRVLDGAIQRSLLKRAWRDAVESAHVAPPPSRFDCNFLSRRGTVIEQVIALFDSDPTLPALLLIGMDSPLADEDEKPAHEGDKSRHDRPGHAVVALLLSRPGLTLPEDLDAAIAREGRDSDLYTPFWDREQRKIAEQGMSWVPLRLQSDLLAMEPFAALCRFRSPVAPRAQNIPSLLEKLLIDAGLNDPQSVGGGAGKDDSSGKSDGADADKLPEFGWLVHNSGSTEDADAVSRLTDITHAVRKVGGDLNSLRDASNLGTEHGDVGAARSVLMLAEGVTRTKQLGKSVLIAEYDEKGTRLDIGLVRPAKIAEMV